MAPDLIDEAEDLCDRLAQAYAHADTRHLERAPAYSRRMLRLDILWQRALDRFSRRLNAPALSAAVRRAAPVSGRHDPQAASLQQGRLLRQAERLTQVLLKRAISAHGRVCDQPSPANRVLAERAEVLWRRAYTRLARRRANF